MSYRFLKGHGTENDFVVLPDRDGSVHGDLSAGRVRALCDRRAGIGGDGVLRAVLVDGRWFMDYRNSDGSLSEMCGNGVRVFARYLHEHEGESFPIEVDTRAGVRTITAADHEYDHGYTVAVPSVDYTVAVPSVDYTVAVPSVDYTVDMGAPAVLGTTKVTVEGTEHDALHVSMGNPHAVTFVDDLAEAGALLAEPGHDSEVFPDGVNVEFVVRRGEHHVAMRVHERGSGETRSCGTGACAVMVATALADQAPRGTSYTVDVPGGTLRIEWTADDRILMTGPSVLVAEGETEL